MRRRRNEEGPANRESAAASEANQAERLGLGVQLPIISFRAEYDRGNDVGEEQYKAEIDSAAAYLARASEADRPRAMFNLGLRQSSYGVAYQDMQAATRGEENTSKVVGLIDAPHSQSHPKGDGVKLLECAQARYFLACKIVDQGKKHTKLRQALRTCVSALRKMRRVNPSPIERLAARGWGHIMRADLHSSGRGAHSLPRGTPESVVRGFMKGADLHRKAALLSREVGDNRRAGRLLGSVGWCLERAATKEGASSRKAFEQRALLAARAYQEAREIGGRNSIRFLKGEAYVLWAIVKRLGQDTPSPLRARAREVVTQALWGDWPAERMRYNRMQALHTSGLLVNTLLKSCCSRDEGRVLVALGKQVMREIVREDRGSAAVYARRIMSFLPGLLSDSRVEFDRCIRDMRQLARNDSDKGPDGSGRKKSVPVDGDSESESGLQRQFTEASSPEAVHARAVLADMSAEGCSAGLIARVREGFSEVLKPSLDDIVTYLKKRQVEEGIIFDEKGKPTSGVPVPEGLCHRLTEILRGAQEATPKDGRGFVDKFRVCFEGFSLKVRLPDGQLTRLKATKSSRGGTIQFSGSVAQPFKTTPVRIVQASNTFPVKVLRDSLGHD